MAEIIRVRAITKCEIGGKTYQPDFIDGLTEKQIEKGLKDGCLAEIPFVKVGKKLKRK